MRHAWILGLTMLTTAAGAEEWHCVAESSVGYSYNDATSKWEPAILKTDARYTIRRPDPDDSPIAQKFKWGVFASEGRDFVSLCDEDLIALVREGVLGIVVASYPGTKGRLECTGLSHFTFDTETMTFMRHGNGNYFSVYDHSRKEFVPDHLLKTVVLEIGRCTAMLGPSPEAR